MLKREGWAGLRSRPHNRHAHEKLRAKEEEEEEEEELEAVETQRAVFCCCSFW